MKKLLILSSLLLLVSCGEGSYSSIVYDSTFNDDLKLLLSSTPIEYDNEIMHFNVAGYKTPSTEHEDYYIFTLELSYKSEEFNNIKIIMVPFSYTLANISNIGTVASVGYNNVSFKLGKETNESEYCFKGYRLSYLIKDDLNGFKVSFKSDNSNMFFSITGDNIL